MTGSFFVEDGTASTNEIGTTISSLIKHCAARKINSSRVLRTSPSTEFSKGTNPASALPDSTAKTTSETSFSAIISPVQGTVIKSIAA